MNTNIETEFADLIVEFKKKYEVEGLKFSGEEFSDLIKKGIVDAQQQFVKLSEPRTLSLDLYTRHWVREVVMSDFALKSMKEVTPDSGDSLLKSLSQFVSSYPPQLLKETQKEVYGASPYEKRQEAFEGKSMIPVTKGNFKQLIKARNKWAQDKGQNSQIDLSLENNKIPRKDYESFVKDIDKVIDYCNSKLPAVNVPDWFYKEFNLPCFLCQLADFPSFENDEEIINQITGLYPILEKFKRKITFTQSDSFRMTYRKESDTFEVFVNRNVNERHHLVGLVHELSHVISHLQNFEADIDPLANGKYLNEKETLEIELTIFKTMSEDLYRAYFAEVLLVLQRVLFEIEIYTSGREDLDKLYAESFNKSFKKGRQKENPLYLLDEFIIFSPLSSLPHAVASMRVIEKQFK